MKYLAILIIAAATLSSCKKKTQTYKCACYSIDVQSTNDTFYYDVTAESKEEADRNCPPTAQKGTTACFIK